MIKYLPLLFITNFGFSQSFAPGPDSTGTTAMHKSNPSFIAWATGGTITRGYVNINDTTVTYDDSNRASYGNLDDAFGIANGTQVVSLGDSGVATLTFDYVIQDAPGYDFAIFENGFIDGYMEFAHVEVSTDGIHFVRFPSTSEIPATPQASNGTIGDCRMVNNLAGKYRVNYGTPFDLNELEGSLNLDLQNINYVRVVDVVGDVDGSHTTLDSHGNPINDPFPTEFHSGGFDLDAIGIINGILSTKEQSILNFTIAPNPATEFITIQSQENGIVRIFDLNGKLLLETPHHTLTTINTNQFQKGIYLLQLNVNGISATERLIVE